MPSPGDLSGAGSRRRCPTPRANTVDGQLRLVYRQVVRNGAMGMDQASYVGAKFGLPPGVVRAAYKKMFSCSAITEDDFVLLIEAAMHDQKLMENRGTVNKNQATLHKEMSMYPYTLPWQHKTRTPPAIVPRDDSPDASPPGPSPFRACPPIFDDQPLSLAFNPSPGNTDRPRAASVPLLPSSSPPRLGALTPLSRQHTGGTLPGSAGGSVGGGGPAKRPGSAAYMRPYTPRPNDTIPVGGRWKWSRIDNNVPKNIRTILLRPIVPPSRPATADVEEDLASNEVVKKAALALKGITRMEATTSINNAVYTVEEDEKQRVGSASGAPHAFKIATPLTAVRNGLQELGLNLDDTDVAELARVTRSLTSDGKCVRVHVMLAKLIPVREMLCAADAGIKAEMFHKFKAQRLTFTKRMSTKEIKLLSILREKLSITCMGGPGDLRKAFTLLDGAQTGKVNHKQMVQALALQGIGMSPVDSEVLYSILDPDGKEGMDYCEFVALMMPPDIADSFEQTHSIGLDKRTSRSRAGLQKNQDTMNEEKANARKAKPAPDEVLKFQHSLTTEQILQVLRNKVAMALKSGPGAVRRWFSCFDSDGNDEVDEVELKGLLVDFGLHLSTTQVAALLARIDTDHSGSVDQDEFVAALLPAEDLQLRTTEREIRDNHAVGKNSTTNTKLDRDALREFLRDKIIRAFVKKGDKVSTGYQIREAVSRFDGNHDGTMSLHEMRKAMNALGLAVDDEMIRTLITCYEGKEKGSAEYQHFVEDIDDSAFTYAFSIGKVAKSGSFEMVEKEATLSGQDPEQKVRNALKASLKKRMTMDGVKSVIKEIRPYADTDGKISLDRFRAALLRMGLKIERHENLERAYKAFAQPNGMMDLYHFAELLDADYELIPRISAAPDAAADAAAKEKEYMSTVVRRRSSAKSSAISGAADISRTGTADVLVVGENKSKGLFVRRGSQGSDVPTQGQIERRSSQKTPLRDGPKHKSAVASTKVVQVRPFGA